MSSRPTADRRPARRTQIGVLVILLSAYILNFVDRQLMGVLASSIKRDLVLSDTELGLLGGLAFVLLYSVVSVPIASLADRYSRIKIISAAVFLWSGLTALCGTAAGFVQLFACRVGVGITEAGGIAPSYSLISDTFLPSQRARALSVLMFGIPIGSALGVFFGGWIASALGWRMTFVVVGLAGVAVAPLVRWGINEPARGGLDKAPGGAESISLRHKFAFITRKPSFWFLSFGAASCQVITYGSFFWLPSMFQRSFGLSVFHVAVYFGSVVLIGGMIGIASGGFVADRIGRDRPGAYALVPAGAFLIAVPVYLLALSTTSLVAAWPLFAIAQAFAIAWPAPIVAATQQIVPASMRATTSASYQTIANLVGQGCGTLVIGMMSDLLTPRFGTDSLRWSIIFGLVFYLIAAALFWAASRNLHRDWHR